MISDGVDLEIVKENIDTISIREGKGTKLGMLEIMKAFQCSRHQINNYYVKYDLPLRKDGNKYYAYASELKAWCIDMNERVRKQKRDDIIERIFYSVASVVIFCILFYLTKKYLM